MEIVKMRTLVTGCAGFIGFHLTKRLLARGDHILGLDNLNDYYDVNLKEARLAQLKEFPHFSFHKLDLADRQGMTDLFQKHLFDTVVHLAAQAGVRYSLTNPYAYVDSNLVGFAHILEGCRHQSVKHLVFASSSSVYGANEKYPFSESDNVDHPIALYAASKKANELMAHSYAHLFQLPCTGLRFFTVYGPWGRPDMALFKFTRNLLADKPIDVYNHGKMSRDFTYIDDIVDGILLTLDHPPEPNSAYSANQPNPAKSNAPYRIYNIGSNNPILLTNFIAILEKTLNKKAIKNFLPLQPGDVPETYADISQLEKDFQYRPRTPLQKGVKNFVEWYLQYFS
ncbi:NAD-dependent epimerase [Coxiella burnetii]|uniref:NAD-dependent epimerase n=1 Tax=Coxiella burnetii TaxID=777 RepID=UPI0009B904F5|nr:NAD-dependent epimerase [Coxiella burnetii]OYK91191.1 NAD-dependent epimerase [Coxiella burnetii]PNT81221.1 NAD-dependent epimerase [Coxiella burnetii]PNT82191.1 NAD-dependent epimerase [Coxiella burnetii]PNT85111.1 NAD-dependent epimerase [Coxiella burnetii]PNT89018.1 NAD-dependent epimerase [Coxiella burnetii]